jgi:hypothetical protein
MVKPKQIVNEELDTDVLNYIDGLEKQLLEANAKIERLFKALDDTITIADSFIQQHGCSFYELEETKEIQNVQHMRNRSDSLKLHDADVIEVALPEKITFTQVTVACREPHDYAMGYNRAINEIDKKIQQLRNSVNKEGE